jgi:hypothetical protein
VLASNVHDASCILRATGSLMLERRYLPRTSSISAKRCCPRLSSCLSSRLSPYLAGTPGLYCPTRQPWLLLSVILTFCDFHILYCHIPRLAHSVLFTFRVRHILFLFHSFCAHQILCISHSVYITFCVCHILCSSHSLSALSILQWPRHWKC